jgi:hypothetical protein
MKWTLRAARLLFASLCIGQVLFVIIDKDGTLHPMWTVPTGAIPVLSVYVAYLLGFKEAVKLLKCGAEKGWKQHDHI